MNESLSPKQHIHNLSNVGIDMIIYRLIKVMFYWRVQGFAPICDALHMGIHYMRSVCRLAKLGGQVEISLYLDIVLLILEQNIGALFMTCEENVCLLIGWSQAWLPFYNILSNYTQSIFQWVYPVKVFITVICLG